MKGALRSPNAVSSAATCPAAPPRYASSIWVSDEGIVATASSRRSIVVSSRWGKYPDLV